MAEEQSVERNTQKARPIPADYGSLTTYVVVRGAAAFLDFVKEAFGAVERGRVALPDGTLGHSEVWIGNRVLNAFDAKDDWPDTPSFLSLYVEDGDKVFRQAVKAGARIVTEMKTNAWGDRIGRVADPFGNIWWIQTHVEDVPQDEMFKRMQQPEYVEQMQYAQGSFDQEMSRRQKSQ